MLEKIKLDNGITIIMQQLDYVKRSSFGIYVRVGAIDETKENNGISHFIEHMMFNGTKTHSKEDIINEMNNLNINGSTSYHYTEYHCDVFNKYLEKGIDLLSDMLINSVFDEDDIEKEKDIIYQEIDQILNRSDNSFYHKIYNKIHQGTSLSFHTSGNKETVKNIKREDLLKFMDKYYTGNNIVLSVAGKFDRDKILDKLTSLFKDINPGKYNYREKYPHNNGKYYIDTDDNMSKIYVGFPTHPLNEEKILENNVIERLLVKNRNSILIKKLREECGLVYSLNSYLEFFDNNARFEIIAPTNEDPHKVLDVMIEELKEFKKTKISEEDLENEKELYKLFLDNLEASFSYMTRNGFQYICKGDVKPISDSLEKIDKITKDDMDKAIDYIFDFDKMTIGINTTEEYMTNKDFEVIE